MLSLSSRAFALRPPSSLFAPSHVIARTIRQFSPPTDPTRRDSDVVDQPQAASSNSMDKITDILDVADLSPRSTNFSVGAKFERVRKGRLPTDLRFLKPTDLLPREDLFRRKRALLGPGAAESRRNDWFHQLGIDPLDEATNPRLLSYFVTDMGKIKGRAETKLTWRNQRRLTKAIRRAKMMGIMPILNKQITRQVPLV